MTSELRLRLISACAMIFAVALVLWAGGWVFTFFVGVIGVLLAAEYWGMARRITRSPSERILWVICGIAYITLACLALVTLPPTTRVILIIAVIAVDSGAYFAGRAIGGPKIAPAISPSKTWAGLGGGIVGAAVVLIGSLALQSMLFAWSAVCAALLAIILAVVAQAGDFLESWLKRKAGLKDSGTLIPGHGGLLDRVDGLMAGAIAAGILHGAGWI